MAKLSLKGVEARVEPVGYRDSYDREFIFELLEAYGKPKSSLTRLRTGSLNVAAEPNVGVAQKNVVYFRQAPQGQSLKAVEELRTAAHVVRYTPRFVIATDFEELVALDMKTRENLVIPIRDIAQHFTFFLPWAGMEKAQYVAEAHADVRAAERVGKLFDGPDPRLVDTLELVQTGPEKAETLCRKTLTLMNSKPTRSGSTRPPREPRIPRSRKTSGSPAAR